LYIIDLNIYCMYMISRFLLYYIYYIICITFIILHSLYYIIHYIFIILYIDYIYYVIVNILNSISIRIDLMKIHSRFKFPFTCYK